MKTAKKSIAVQGVRGLRVGVVALVAVLCLLPLRLQCQSQGNNAVYSMSGMDTGSTAFVDASVWDGMNSYAKGDVCADVWQAFNYGVALSTVPMAVIDARGIPQPSGGFSCSATPWTVGAAVTLPSVILLPAGKIPIGAAWVLPNKLEFLGEGADTTSSGTNGTILTASGFTGYMVQFGTNAACGPCFGIGIEDLTLDGGSISNVNGITNQFSQERSYVNRVSLRNFAGTGLDVRVYSGAEFWTLLQHHVLGQQFRQLRCMRQNFGNRPHARYTWLNMHWEWRRRRDLS